MRIGICIGLFLACGIASCSSETEGEKTARLSDCEAICKEGEKVSCGGDECLSRCKADKKEAEGACEEEADAYFACARNAESVTCSGGFLSFFGCSESESALVQCIANRGDGGSGGGSGGGTTTSAATTSQSTASSGSGGPSFTCESFEAQGGLGCPDSDPDNCVCYGCGTSDSCTAEVDCTCSQCAEDSFCTSNCSDDGVCNPYFEGCSCADCAAIPACAP